YKSYVYEIAAAARHLPVMLAILLAAGATIVAPLVTDFLRGLLLPEIELPIGESGALTTIPSSRHILGVFRMGTDPATSVTDPFGKFHDLTNLYSGDGAVWPTSAGMNPS